MTGEELALAREKQQHRTAALAIVAILLAILALCATAIYGCRKVYRCPDRLTLRDVCDCQRSARP